MTVAQPPPPAKGNLPSRVNESVQPEGADTRKSAAVPQTSTPAPAPAAVATAGRLAATAPAPPVGPPVAPADAHADVTSAAERWLNAYYRQDAAGMASLATRDMNLSDSRTRAERVPAGLNVKRSLEQVTIQLVGQSAVLSARMTEQTDASKKYVSWISQVWIREADRWRLLEVRIVGDLTKPNQVT